MFLKTCRNVQKKQCTLCIFYFLMKIKDFYSPRESGNICVSPYFFEQRGLERGAGPHKKKAAPGGSGWL